jgi:hypothetical protein
MYLKCDEILQILSLSWHITTQILNAIKNNNVTHQTFWTYKPASQKILHESTYCQKTQTALAYHRLTPYYDSPASVQQTGVGGCQNKTTMKMTSVAW